MTNIWTNSWTNKLINIITYATPPSLALQVYLADLPAAQKMKEREIWKVENRMGDRLRLNLRFQEPN